VARAAFYGVMAAMAGLGRSGSRAVGAVTPGFGAMAARAGGPVQINGGSANPGFGGGAGSGGGGGGGGTVAVSGFTDGGNGGNGGS
ncbi:Mycobacterium terramassiliense ORFan, partial [Mycobacterium terramassiliense]